MKILYSVFESSGSSDEQETDLEEFDNQCISRNMNKFRRFSHQKMNTGDAAGGVMQCSPSSETDPLPKRTRKSRQPAEMAAFCFCNIFDNLNAKVLVELNNAFAKFDGKMPSRREIRILSPHIGISQSRIRKWFLDQINEAPDQTVLPLGSTLDLSEERSGATSPAIPELEARLVGFGERLDRVDFDISTLKSQVDVLSCFSTNWPI